MQVTGTPTLSRDKKQHKSKLARPQNHPPFLPTILVTMQNFVETFRILLLIILQPLLYLQKHVHYLTKYVPRRVRNSQLDIQTVYLQTSSLDISILPYDVLRTLTDFLDVGDIISLGQANQHLRNSIRHNDRLWRDLLRHRLHVIPRTADPYHEMMQWTRVRRCAICHRMDSLRQRPYIDLFF